MGRSWLFKQEWRHAVFWRAVAGEFAATLILEFIQICLLLRWPSGTAKPLKSLHEPEMFSGNLLHPGYEGFGRNTPLNGKEGGVTFSGQLGGPIEIAVGMAFTLALLVEGFGPICGAVMNPAVSIALTIVGRHSLVRCISYIFAQCLGAITAGYIVLGLTPGETSLKTKEAVDYLHNKFAATAPGDWTTDWQAMLLEVIITFILVTTILSVTDDSGGRRRVQMPGVPIGLAVGVGIFAAGPPTGASMNPARSIGSAAVSGVWTSHWVYWVGPICGGLLAAGLYYLVLADSRPSIDDTEESNGIPSLTTVRMTDDANANNDYSIMESDASDINKHNNRIQTIT